MPNIGESRLLPCQNDEDLARRIDGEMTQELMSSALANLNSIDEYWSNKDSPFRLG
jgi:hypothetical protein